MMTKNDFLRMRRHLMIDIDDAVDNTELHQDIKDGLVTELCDLICDRLDPNGLIAEHFIQQEN